MYVFNNYYTCFKAFFLYDFLTTFCIKPGSFLCNINKKDMTLHGWKYDNSRCQVSQQSNNCRHNKGKKKKSPHSFPPLLFKFIQPFFTHINTPSDCHIIPYILKERYFQEIWKTRAFCRVIFNVEHNFILGYTFKKAF